MKKIHLIMPMGGAGSRFTKEGFELPKPLLKINDKPFLYWSTQSIVKFVDVLDITFIVLQEHIEKYNIDSEIKKYYPNAKIVIIPQVLNGAVLTCLEGVKNIEDDCPIIFNDCDHIFKSSEFNELCQKGDFENIDGALLTFKSNDPKFSFVKLNEEGKVIGTIEKQVVSDDAICGAYYFKNTALFKEMTNIYLDKCNYSEYFVSGVYNVMADNNKNIIRMTTDYHVAFGTPEEYEEALKSDKFTELI